MIAAILVMLAVLAPADEVAQAEQQRLDAIRRGQDIARFYAPDYRGINALGQYETREQIVQLKADPNYARVRDVSVEVRDDSVIVTGVEGTAHLDAGEWRLDHRGRPLDVDRRSRRRAPAVGTASGSRCGVRPADAGGRIAMAVSERADACVLGCQSRKLHDLLH
jgi:hypothetical protein